MDQLVIDYVKAQVAAMKRPDGTWLSIYAEPHMYQPTCPYRGCGTCGRGCGKCGIGPGAFHHNEFFVRDYEQVKKAGLL